MDAQYRTLSSSDILINSTVCISHDVERDFLIVQCGLCGGSVKVYAGAIFRLNARDFALAHLKEHAATDEF